MKAMAGLTGQDWQLCFLGWQARSPRAWIGFCPSVQSPTADETDCRTALSRVPEVGPLANGRNFPQHRV
jgi:hypothetical protein